MRATVTTPTLRVSVTQPRLAATSPLRPLGRPPDRARAWALDTTRARGTTTLAAAAL